MKKCEGCLYYQTDRTGTKRFCCLCYFGLKCEGGDQYNGKK